MVHSRRVTVARARPLASRSRAKPSMSARRTANRLRERARHQLVNWRRSSAYASRVRPRYPARNPASASRSASLNAGWRGRGRLWKWRSSGTSRSWLRPMRLGQPRPQQRLGTTIKRPVRHLLSRSAQREAEHCCRETLQIADSARKDRQVHASHGAPRSAILVRFRSRERRIMSPGYWRMFTTGFTCVNARAITAAGRAGCLSVMIMAGEPR